MENARIEPLDRFSDERGWVSEVYSGELGAQLQNIHLGSMEPGVVRGNHRHNESREWIVFLSVPIMIRLGTPADYVEQTIEEPSVVSLPPGVAHAFKNTGKSVAYFTAYRDTRYNEDNPDAETIELL
ncbi:MAG: hypothetical protein ABEJ65_10355 [bacterium]